MFLKNLQREKSQIYDKTIEWIKDLRIDLDYEDGEKFLKFIKKNLKLPDPYNFFFTFSLKF